MELSDFILKFLIILIGVFHGMAPMARAIAEAVEKS